jgi:hypothetical protein
VSSEPPHTPSRPHTQPTAQPHVQPQGQSQVQPSPVGQPTATHHDISTVLAREPCAGCGAPLGADQRYCLSCGIPRSGTRLPFLDVLHSEAAAAGVVEAGSQPASLLRMAALAPAEGPTPSGGWGGQSGGPAARLREYTPLFALLGVLLLALLIGLLLGHWASGGAKTVAATPAKQVVEVKGLPAATAAPAVTAPATAATATTPAPSSSGTSGGKAATTSTPHATSPTVSKLAQTTGKEHAKEVEKALAKGGGVLTTGGAPPPKEPSKAEANKPIGGGSEVTNIE